jgi:hypothetical protein
MRGGEVFRHLILKLHLLNYKGLVAGISQAFTIFTLASTLSFLEHIELQYKIRGLNFGLGILRLANQISKSKRFDVNLSLIQSFSPGMKIL